MAGRFEGQVAWITGGGSGIGKALALELARQGADVAVSGRRLDRLEEVAGEIEALGRRSLAVRCDVTDEDSIAEAVGEVVDELGGIDVAVANAGWAVSGRISDLTAEQWRKQLDVNVVGAALTAKHALPFLEERRGRLALVGSIAAYMGLAKNGAYAASKWGVRAIGQTLNIELAGTGVSCTTIHPGFVESEIAQVDNEGVFHEKRKDRRPRKLMWSAEAAAKTMAKAIHRRKREHVFTNHGKLGAFMGQHFPGLTVFTMGRAAKPKKALPR
jgi:NAD(P)-dependent dehydrogenase (short-subunit alcohol dehydrogenase family)